MAYVYRCTKLITEQSLAQLPDLHAFLKSDPPDAGLLRNIDTDFLYPLTYQNWSNGTSYPLKLRLIQILSFRGFEAHIKALKLPPDQIKPALQADDHAAVRWAIETDHSETFKFLIEYLDPSEIKSVILKEQTVDIFRGNSIEHVCSRNQLNILQAIRNKLTPADLQEVLERNKFEAIASAIEFGCPDIIEELKSFLIPSEIEKLFVRTEYRPILKAIEFADLEILEKLEGFLDTDKRNELLVHLSGLEMLYKGFRAQVINKRFSLLVLKNHLALLDYFDKVFLLKSSEKIKENVRSTVKEVINLAFRVAFSELNDKKEIINEKQYKVLLEYKDVLEYLLKEYQFILKDLEQGHVSFMSKISIQDAKKQINRLKEQGFRSDKVASPAQVGIFRLSEPNNGDG